MRSDACGSLVPNRLRTCVKRRPEEAAHPCVGTRRLPAFDVPRAHHLSCNFDQNTHGHTQSEPSDVHCTRKNKPKKQNHVQCKDQGSDCYGVRRRIGQDYERHTRAAVIGGEQGTGPDDEQRSSGAWHGGA